MQGAAENGDARPDGGSVLWRRVVAARRMSAGAGPGAADPGPSAAPTPERAIAGAIGRAADRVHGLRLFFDRIDVGQAVLAELPELVPERALISVVEGPAEALGLVALCPGLLGAVIEMQATGRVSARPPGARRPTRTDGLICADLVNACLAELGDALAALPGHEGLRGFRYASFLDDPRPLELMLEDSGFHLVQVRLRLGDAGQRDGRILFALPARAKPAARPVLPSAEGVGPVESGPGTVTLADAVQGVPIDLAGILCRRMIALGDLRNLSSGDTIPLPPGVLASATLETAAGQVLFRGKLGELGGRHALRLTRTREERSARAGEGTECAPGDLPQSLTHSSPLADLGAPDTFRLHPPDEPQAPRADDARAALAAGNGAV